MRITPRLRVTACLSLLGLAIGILGTQWLSGRTADWAGPRHAVVATHTAPAARRYRADRDRDRHAAPRAVAAARPQDGALAAATMPPELVPVSMPPLSSRYAPLEHHLDGTVVLAIAIDGSGRARSLRLQRSSGDPVLDDYAQHLARGWRFAVPPDHPSGIEGELPMRFGTAAR